MVADVMRGSLSLSLTRDQFLFLLKNYSINQYYTLSTLFATAIPLLTFKISPLPHPHHGPVL